MPTIEVIEFKAVDGISGLTGVLRAMNTAGCAIAIESGPDMVKVVTGKNWG